MDYDLTKLGPRDFEHLSQALALHVLGPGVEVFGDGPDGGREASFEGLQEFPSADAPWRGYGVLQAKFRQRPERTGDDAKWLIRHITAELREWADPESGRARNGRMPEYILFTSNVLLSSIPRTGGIDRVQEAILQQVQELGLPLKGWAVWHGEKICRLLDDRPGLRRTYAHAVTSGDVLSTLQDALLEGRFREAGADASAPAGLPRELRPLVGREMEIEQGLRHLAVKEAADRPIIAVTGPPGIGKSAFALRLARLGASAFPDGQHHVDLSPALPGGNSADLISEVLRAIRRPDEILPEGRQQQAALLRATLLHRQVLILVDDVPSESALLELLSMEGPFALVCTSRAKLSGLAGLVRFVELGPLPAEQSCELIEAITGSARLSNEQASSLADTCGGHPLALQIAAAHLARRPRMDVDEYLRDIASPDHGLQALTAGQTALEPVIERSFAALGPDQAGLLESLGMLPHISITPDVAAAALVESTSDIDDTAVRRATQLLDSLFELSLIEQTSDDRYMFHEVLHRFARLQSSTADQARRETVISQVCLVLACRARAATHAIGFIDQAATLPAESNASALHTLEADRPGAVVMTELAHQHRLWNPLVVLAAEITPWLRQGSHWKDIAHVYQFVLNAGSASATPDWQATALHNLGMASGHLGDTPAAIEFYERCARTAYDARELHLAFLAQLALAGLLINLGRAQEAIPLLRHGLTFWRLIEDDSVLARALRNLGTAYRLVGKIRRSDHYLRNSRRVSERIGEADFIQSEFGTLLRSRTAAEAALEAWHNIERARAVGNPEWEANSLLRLASILPADRPASAPANPVETALDIYRRTEDVRGQVRALHLLGTEAAEGGQIQEAAQHLDECAHLAAEIGDFERGAIALAYLGSYSGGLGRQEEAEEYFNDAKRMAQATGSPVVLAQVLERQANYSRLRGSNDKAVSLLSQAVRLMEDTDDAHGLAEARAALGEALVAAGRWQEGAQVLQAVLSVMSDGASPDTRAQAYRSLGVLYSRRGLHKEAASAMIQALTYCEEAQRPSGIMQCRLALGNLHARQRSWSAALDEYQAAAKIALARKDLHVLLTARGMMVTCRLNGEDADEAVADGRRLIPLADQLGMPAAKAALHANIASHFATNGQHEEAVEEFRIALSIADELADHGLRASFLQNLARSRRALGDIADSRNLARDAFAIHQRLGHWSEAAESLLFLMQLHQPVVSDAQEDPSMPQLVGAGQRVDQRVLAALWALARNVTGDNKDTVARSPAASRRINIADSVRRELHGVDLESIVGHLGNVRNWCFTCDLPIAETGDAELLLLHTEEVDTVRMRLAHPQCLRSDVIELKGQIREAPRENFEIECILFGGDTAGVIVDCYGGWGIDRHDGKLRDVLLEVFRSAGFVDLQPMILDSDGKPVDMRDVTDVEALQASLDGDLLTITGPESEVLGQAPLSFLPHWYERALEGSLVVVLGRNLQGMASDDPSYLVRAIALGDAVGATVALAVAPPSRNGPCVCTPSTGRKFKRCCGRRSEA
ncbi:tetratricopeptide repeat protein [Streptomyces sp. NPDC048550]|uniref:tetratricopeptide repeat protein n=1 Tax=Streptomyces sp. NPDC048550 TaxID=3155739 RepID=UPI0034284214